MYSYIYHNINLNVKLKHHTTYVSVEKEEKNKAYLTNFSHDLYEDNKLVEGNNRKIKESFLFLERQDWLYSVINMP